MDSSELLTSDWETILPLKTVLLEGVMKEDVILFEGLRRAKGSFNPLANSCPATSQLWSCLRVRTAKTVKRRIRRSRDESIQATLSRPRSWAASTGIARCSGRRQRHCQITLYLFASLLLTCFSPWPQTPWHQSHHHCPRRTAEQAFQPATDMRQVPRNGLLWLTMCRNSLPHSSLPSKLPDDVTWTIKNLFHSVILVGLYYKWLLVTIPTIYIYNWVV